MKDNWAEDFYEILESLRLKDDLSQRVKQLIANKEIVGKSLKGENRKQYFRDILTDLVDGNISLEESYVLVETQISRNSSIYREDNRVFSDHWGERLVRTNLSKFYNQAVLLFMLDNGNTTCFIPHTSYEQGPRCSLLAGQKHDARRLLQKLEQAFEEGVLSRDIIPDYPHCTHVVIPIE